MDSLGNGLAGSTGQLATVASCPSRYQAVWLSESG